MIQEKEQHRKDHRKNRVIITSENYLNMFIQQNKAVIKYKYSMKIKRKLGKLENKSTKIASLKYN